MDNFYHVQWLCLNYLLTNECKIEGWMFFCLKSGEWENEWEVMNECLYQGCDVVFFFYASRTYKIITYFA